MESIRTNSYGKQIVVFELCYTHVVRTMNDDEKFLCAQYPFEYLWKLISFANGNFCILENSYRLIEQFFFDKRDSCCLVFIINRIRIIFVDIRRWKKNKKIQCILNR